VLEHPRQSFTDREVTAGRIAAIAGISEFRDYPESVATIRMDLDPQVFSRFPIAMSNSRE